MKKQRNLAEGLRVEQPGQRVADITYIPTREDYSYLSLVTDAYSQKIWATTSQRTCGQKALPRP